MFSESLIAQKFDRPSQWQAHKASLCKGCYSLCCRLPVEIKLDDLKRLGVVEEDYDPQRKSLKKLAKVLETMKIIRSFRVQTGLFMLAQKASGDCIFLDSEKRLCTVYEKRPGVCRRFPDVGPRPGYCPALSTQGAGAYKSKP